MYRYILPNIDKPYCYSGSGSGNCSEIFSNVFKIQLYLIFKQMRRNDIVIILICGLLYTLITRTLNYLGKLNVFSLILTRGREMNLNNFYITKMKTKMMELSRTIIALSQIHWAVHTVIHIAKIYLLTSLPMF